MPGQSILTKLINCEAIITQPLLLQSCKAQQVAIDVLRLDLIHPVISGNKYFKLRLPVTRALENGAKGIISFGGAHSNHLVALSFLCQATGLECIGIIRGEEPKRLSDALKDSIAYGMRPVYVSRATYSDKQQLEESYLHNNPGFIIIPEGGQTPEGVLGAEDILSYTNPDDYDVIACAVGTGTMMAGILKASRPSQKVLGISALRIAPGNDIEKFIIEQCPGQDFEINYDYHFGGYAKKNPALLAFMNSLWHEHQLPTDFVYTAKLIYALDDLVKKQMFPPGTRILAVHSGGLQGNRSLDPPLLYQPQ